MTDVKDLKKGDRIRYLGRNAEYSIPHRVLWVGDVVTVITVSDQLDVVDYEGDRGVGFLSTRVSKWELVKEPKTYTLQSKEDFRGKAFRTKDEEEFNYVLHMLASVGFSWESYTPLWEIKGIYVPKTGFDRILNVLSGSDLEKSMLVLNKPTYTATEIVEPLPPTEKELLQKKLEEHKASMKELEDQINNLKE